MSPQGGFPTQARLGRKFSVHANDVVNVQSNIVLPAIECLFITLLKLIGKSKHEVSKRIVRELTVEIVNSFSVCKTEAFLPVTKPFSTKRQVVPALGDIDVVSKLIIVLEYSKRRA